MQDGDAAVSIRQAFKEVKAFEGGDYPAAPRAVIKESLGAPTHHVSI